MRVAGASTLNAIGLIAFAAAIIVQISAGVDLYPTIPPGVVISFLIAGLVLFGTRWRWTTIVGLLFPVWLLIGGIANREGWLALLNNPSRVVFAATIIQMLGLAIALIAGVVAVWKVYWHHA